MHKYNRSGLGWAVNKWRIKVWVGRDKLGFFPQSRLIERGKWCTELRPGWEAWIILRYGPNLGLCEFRKRGWRNTFPTQLVYALHAIISNSLLWLKILLIKRRSIALTLRELTQESGGPGLKLWALICLLPSSLENSGDVWSAVLNPLEVRDPLDPQLEVRDAPLFIHRNL